MKRVARTLAILFALLGLGTVCVVVFGYWRVAHPSTEIRPLPDGLIALDSAEGEELLHRAEAALDYDRLRLRFVGQEQGQWAAVASAVVVLNALADDAEQPLDMVQREFLTADTDSVRPWWRIAFSGMSIAELAAMLRSHGAEVDLVLASETNAEDFRKAAIRNLRKRGDYLLVDYERATLGQQGTGNMSPVAAYDRKTDRFLVLDVATHRYPPAWVEADRLFSAMSAIDPDTGTARGYLEVRARDQATSDAH